MKVKVNLSIDEATVAEARAHGLNMSKLAEGALAKASKAARNAAWVKENQAALHAYARQIEEEGCALAEYRRF